MPNGYRTSVETNFSRYVTGSCLSVMVEPPRIGTAFAVDLKAIARTSHLHTLFI